MSRYSNVSLTLTACGWNKSTHGAEGHQVTIENESATALPADTRVRLVADDHFRSTSAHVGAVEAYSTKDVNLTMRARGGANISTLTGKTTVRLESKGSTIKQTTFHTSDMRSYLQDLKDLNAHGEALNILVYGIMGTGKSSMIHTLMTMLSLKDAITQHVAVVRGGSDHGTTTLRKHELEGLNTSLWDSWGLSDENYKNSELTAIVNGFLPSHWKMHRAMDSKENQAAIMQNLNTSKFRRAHCVLFFIPASFAEDNPEQMEVAKKQFDAVTNMGLNPIVVVSRGDELASDLRDDPMMKLPSAQTQQLPQPAQHLNSVCQQVAQYFGIPLSRVHVSVPYKDEEERQFDLERRAYKLLEAAMHAAMKKQQHDAKRAQLGAAASNAQQAEALMSIFGCAE
jgi:hypothetical protein